MPPSDWGCQCDVTNTDEPVTGVPGDDEAINPVFANNPAKTAEFINIKEHPMVKAVTDEDVASRIEKFAKIAIAEEIEKVTEKKFKSGGVIQTPKKFNQNSNEEKKNISIYTYLAKKFGYKYKLLNVINENGRKNPDARNLEKEYFSDAKIPESLSGKNAIQNSIKTASTQRVTEVVIDLSINYPMIEIWSGLKAALQDGRAANVKHIIIKMNSGELKKYDADKLRAIFNKKRDT